MWHLLTTAARVITPPRLITGIDSFVRCGQKKRKSTISRLSRLHETRRRVDAIGERKSSFLFSKTTIPLLWRLSKIIAATDFLPDRIFRYDAPTTPYDKSVAIWTRVTERYCVRTAEHRYRKNNSNSFGEETDTVNAYDSGRKRFRACLAPLSTERCDRTKSLRVGEINWKWFFVLNRTLFTNAYWVAVTG